MSESLNLWALPLQAWAAGGCDVAALLVGALLVALAIFAVSIRFLR